MWLSVRFALVFLFATTIGAASQAQMITKVPKVGEIARDLGKVIVCQPDSKGLDGNILTLIQAMREDGPDGLKTAYESLHKTTVSGVPVCTRTILRPFRVSHVTDYGIVEWDFVTSRLWSDHVKKGSMNVWILSLFPESVELCKKSVIHLGDETLEPREFWCI